MTKTTETAVLENETKTEVEETEENEDNGESGDEKESKLAKIRDETITELIEQRHQVKQAEYDLEDAKISQKLSKNSLEAKQEKLNRLVEGHGWEAKCM